MYIRALLKVMMMVPVIMMKEIDEDEGTFDFQVAPVLSPADLLLSISNL